MNRRNFLSAALGLAATRFSRPGASVERHASTLEGTRDVTGTTTSAPPSQEIDFASALDAAEAVRTKKVSSVELTRHMFERSDRYNPQINAFVYQLREEALKRAEECDAALGQGRSLGVFHGVPI